MIRPGDVIRGIRIIERLGEGGMGEVFLGVQEKIGREVAVKAIHRDHRLDPSAKARFLREANILAQLEHPNICRLYDSIETDEHELIVLELVRGRNLRELLSEPLSTEKKMEIAEQVFTALEAAHAISVIHRDLKPENIMVTDDGTVKVLDFGLARHVSSMPKVPVLTTDETATETPTQPETADDPSLTRMGHVVGTLRYMSPEQARGDELTAASDIYVAGTVLHELWTGRPPYDTGLSPREIAVQAMTGQFNPQIGDDHDLSALISDLTALEPRERPSAAAALDRLCWIRERPRRRARKRMVTAVFTAMAIAVIASTAGFFHARHSQQRAETARAQAEAVNDFIQGMLASAAPGKQGIDTKVIEVLDDASARVDGDLADHPLTRAAVHLTLGRTYDALGAWPTAIEHFETAAAIRKEVLGADHRDTLLAQLRIGSALTNEGKFGDAEFLLSNLYDRSLELFGADDEAIIAIAHANAIALQRLGDYDAAEILIRDEVAHTRRVYGDDDERTVSARHNLATLMARRGGWQEAEAEFREICTTWTRTLGPDHPRTLKSAHNLATAITRSGSDTDEAVAIFTDVIDRRRRVLGDEHPDTLHSLGDLGSHLRRIGRFEEAEYRTREALEIQLSTIGEEHPNTITSQMNLAIILAKMGRRDEAEALLRDALPIAERTLGTSHRNTLNILGNLGNLLAASERYDEAETIQRRMIAEFEASLGKDHPTTWSSTNALVNTLIALGRITEAEALVTEILAKERAALGPEDSKTLNALGNHGRILRAQGRGEAAEAVFRELLGSSEKVFGADHPRTDQARNDLAAVLEENGKFDEAEAIRNSSS